MADSKQETPVFRDSKIDDGGLAFPSPQCGDWSPEYGMSMRDYIATQALPAVIASTCAGQHMPQMREGETHIRFAMARDAYDMADAMIAARKAGA